MAKAKNRPWAELRSEMVQSPARAVGTLYRRFQAAATDTYERLGWNGATLSHVQFLTEIDEEGTRLSDVAAALGTTKQYVGKLARELEARALISLGADPTDRRAVLAKPTAKGRSFFADACDVRAELEAEFLAGLSPTRAATFVAMLGELVAARTS